MKKTLLFILVTAVIASCCFSTISFAGTDEKTIKVTYSEEISIKAQTGELAGGNSGWGNHESRIAHTTHGDYAAYCTEQINANDGTTFRLTGFTIIKIMSDGTAISLLHDYRAYESSGVTIFTDGDENVWVVEIGDSRIRVPGDPGVHVTAYRVDAVTDEVVAYSATYDVTQYGTGFGYGAAAYDPYTNKIIAETADGDPHIGENLGYVEWFFFDIETLSWEKEYCQVKVDYRYCYPFILPDGKGGMYIAFSRDYRCTSAGYPEIGDHETGIDKSKLTKEQKSFLSYDQSAGWVWDTIRLYYIPDVTKTDMAGIWIEEADYSKVLGDTFEERCQFENRLNSWYPNFQMNNGGDAYIDKDGYLHIIWYKLYLYAALTRAEADCMFYHDVYDIRNVNAVEDFSKDLLISRSEIRNEVTDGKRYSFRLYEDEAGNLYYISVDCPVVTSAASNCPQKIKKYYENKAQLRVYALDGTPQTGYTFREIASQGLTCANIVNICNRGGKFIDGNVALLVLNGSDYRYYNINIDAIGVTATTPEGVKLDRTVFPYGTDVKVEDISDLDGTDSLISAIGLKVNKSKIYSFEAKLDGKAVGPEKPVEVIIDIPDDFDKEKVTFWHINEGMKAELVSSSVNADGKLVVALEHFSSYVMAELDEAIIPTPTPSEETPVPTAKPSDDDPEEFDPTVLYIVVGVLVAALVAIVAFVTVKKIRAKK